MAARAFSFSILRSEVLSLLTSRFPADGSVDDYNYILNKNFTNFNGVSTAAISSASTTDTDRTPGTYNNVPHADNANQGSGATFNIRINSDGTATLLAVNASGSGYSVTGGTASKRLTISNSVLGGGTELTGITVSNEGTNTDYAGTYTVTQGKEFDTANDQFVNNASQNYFRSATSGTANIIAWDSTESAWYIIPSVDQSDFSYTADTEIEVSDWGSSATNPAGASSVYGTITTTTTSADDVLLDVSSILSDPSAEIVFGRNITRNPTHRTLTAKFGDGYEQRVLDGINSKDETFSVNFANRDWSEIEVIAAFLDAKAARSFNITLQRETFKVVCDKYSITYNQVDIHSLNATFRRVYEP